MEPCRGSRRFKKQERKVYNDDGLDDEEIEGKREFSVAEKLQSDKYDFNFITQLIGSELTLKWVQEHGFSTPLLIKEKTGLGMRVPSENFNVNDVKRCVGSRRRLDVMDTRTQQGIDMTMKEWADYFTSSTNPRTRLLNVISLEFSHTRLENYVEQPAIVHQMDWVDRAWPRELKQRQTETTNIIREMRYPKVQRYCLMSVAECYTDFHIDMGGTSVWYHILHGRKVFWMIPPTEENLVLYEKWTLSGKQGDMFFGDKVKQCQKVTLEAGYTFFIPPGWIHAVFTPQDSLVFGGNFIHSFNIPTQLRCFEVENTTHVPQKFRYPFFVEMHWYVVERYVSCLTGRSHRQPAMLLCDEGPPPPQSSSSSGTKSLGSLSECSSGGGVLSGRCGERRSLEDSTQFSPPGSPIADEHNYVSPTVYTDANKHSDMKNNKNYNTAAAECSLRPVSVKLEKLSPEKVLMHSPPATPPAPWVHLTTHELNGLAVMLDWLEGLAAHRKHVPKDIEDWQALVADARKLLSEHANDDPALALSGETVLKWPQSKRPYEHTKKVSRRGNSVPGRRRRVRCKTCEACTRHDCGECKRCKDMRKFGGPGRMKQTCYSRQCMAPELPNMSACHVCAGTDGIGRDTVTSPSGALMECHACWRVSHPRCAPSHLPPGQVNEDLPNSWLCPRCVRGDVDDDDEEDYDDDEKLAQDDVDNDGDTEMKEDDNLSPTLPSPSDEQTTPSSVYRQTTPLSADKQTTPPSAERKKIMKKKAILKMDSKVSSCRAKAKNSTKVVSPKVVSPKVVSLPVVSPIVVSPIVISPKKNTVNRDVTPTKTHNGGTETGRRRQRDDCGGGGDGVIANKRILQIRFHIKPEGTKVKMEGVEVKAEGSEVKMEGSDVSNADMKVDTTPSPVKKSPEVVRLTSRGREVVRPSRYLN